MKRKGNKFLLVDAYNLDSYKGYTICTDIKLNNNKIIYAGMIIGDLIVKDFELNFKNKKILISKENIIDKEDLINFLCEKFLDSLLNEIVYMYYRYDFKSNEINSKLFNMININLLEVYFYMETNIKTLDYMYILQLLSNPVILSKTLDMFIITYYILKRNVDTINTSKNIDGDNTTNTLDASFYYYKEQMKYCDYSINSLFGENLFKDYIESKAHCIDESSEYSPIKRIIKQSVTNNFIYTNDENLTKNTSAEVLNLANNLLSFRYNSKEPNKFFFKIRKKRYLKEIKKQGKENDYD